MFQLVDDPEDTISELTIYTSVKNGKPIGKSAEGRFNPGSDGPKKSIASSSISRTQARHLLTQIYKDADTGWEGVHIDAMDFVDPPSS
ncbi:MAG: hypothetical protein HOL85_04965 [Rhodospirillaceae bacterium]|nr:hypothetical protein [Rhodospirillaceae bacterium]